MSMSISELIFEVQSTMDDIAGLNECGRCGGSGYIPAFTHVDSGRCFKCYPTEAQAEVENAARQIAEAMDSRVRFGEPVRDFNTGQTAHDLMVCEPTCDDCMYEAAGKRGEDW